jgi:hypothetical protein
MDIELLVTRSDGKATCMDLTASQLALLNSTLSVGADGFGQGYGSEDDENAMWSLIGELKEFEDEPEWDALAKEALRVAKLRGAQTLLESAGYTVAKRDAVD